MLISSIWPIESVDPRDQRTTLLRYFYFAYYFSTYTLVLKGDKKLTLSQLVWRDCVREDDSISFSCLYFDLCADSRIYSCW